MGENRTMQRVLRVFYFVLTAFVLTACFELVAQSKYVQVEKNSVNNSIRLGPSTEESDTVVIYTIVSHPSHGTVELEASNIAAYTPDPDYVGTDKFTFKLSDGEEESNVATITITVVDTDEEPSEDPNATVE